MSELIVYSASAGSGKTYTLAREYITQVIRRPLEYRSILAVTFTNKATEEMKSRIIEELHQLAIYQPEQSTGRPSYLTFLVEELGAELQLSAQRNGLTLEQEVSARAQKVLTAILHDYSNFAISTIDKFFQRVVRNFVSELNIQPGYALELDTDRVLSLAVDRVLEGLYEDETLQRWLFDLVEERLDDGASWELADVLNSLARQLLREDFRQLSPEFFGKIADKTFLEGYFRRLVEENRAIEQKYKSLGEEAKRLMQLFGVGIDDFPYKKSGFAGIFEKAANGVFDDVGKRAQEAFNNPDKWAGKKDSKITDAVYSALNPILGEIIAFLGSTYNTYKVVIKNFRTLGVLADIDRQVRQLANEDNLLLISDTNLLVNKLIADTDAPFIYEKMGNRFSSYLIDEFQDTSATQYENFRPLLENSLAQGGFGLVVGDVKQSIYRWRNGDWETLGKHIVNHFDPRQVALDTNFRSLQNVVTFNNNVFPVMVNLMQNRYQGDMTEEPEISLKAVYKDVFQKVPATDSKRGGYVHLEKVMGEEGDSSADRTELVLQKLVAQIAELQRERGYRPSDIAILVRRGKEGQQVAQALLEARNKAIEAEKHFYSFISQGALFLTSSDAVNLIVAVLRLLLQDQQAISTAIVSYIKTLEQKQPVAHHSFDPIPDERLSTLLGSISNLPLTEAVEAIIAEYGLNRNASELPFLGDFCDVVLNFSERKVADVRSFVEWWDEKGSRTELYLPGREEAITILTVHKSKGLQYGVVMIPFFSWDVEPGSGRLQPLLWVDGQGAALDDFSLERLPVYYGKDLKNTPFAAEALREQGQSYIDNLNLAYVALTRAERELYIYIPQKKSKTEDKKLSGIGDFLFAAALHSFPPISLDGGEIPLITFGEKGQGVQPETSTEQLSIPLTAFRIGKPLSKIKQRYSTSVAEGSGNLKKGLLMHRLFSLVGTLAELPTAIGTLVEEGWMLPEEVDEVMLQVQEKLTDATVRGWFDARFKVVNEGDIIIPGEEFLVRRPDRVMLAASETVVVDFKFGEVEEQSHRYQVFGYINTLRKMGYPNVRGYLWYFDHNHVVELD